MVKAVQITEDDWKNFHGYEGLEQRINSNSMSLGERAARAGKTFLKALTFNLGTDNGAVDAAISQLKSMDSVTGNDVWEKGFEYHMSRRSKKALAERVEAEFGITKDAIKSDLQYSDFDGTTAGTLQGTMNKLMDATLLSKLFGHLELYRNKETGEGLDYHRNLSVTKAISPEGRALIAGLMIGGTPLAMNAGQLATAGYAALKGSALNYTGISTALGGVNAGADSLQQTNSAVLQGIGSYGGALAGVAAIAGLGALAYSHTGNIFPLLRTTAATTGSALSLGKNGKYRRLAETAGYAALLLGMGSMIAGCNHMLGGDADNHSGDTAGGSSGSGNNHASAGNPHDSDYTSPFSNSYNYNRHDPLWDLLAKADAQGNQDGNVSQAEFNAVANANQEARYDNLFAFASGFSGDDASRAWDGSDVVSIDDAKNYLHDNLTNGLHNFANSQRYNHDGIGTFKPTDDGRFHFDFDENNPHAKTFFNTMAGDPAKNEMAVGYQPDENDLVVRVFPNNSGTPLAVFDIGSDGYSHMGVGADGANLTHHQIEEVMAGVHNGNYVAEAAFIDRKGSIEDIDNVRILHSYCPVQYKNDDVHIVGRINDWQHAGPAPGPGPAPCKGGNDINITIHHNIDINHDINHYPQCEEPGNSGNGPRPPQTEMPSGINTKLNVESSPWANHARNGTIDYEAVAATVSNDTGHDVDPSDVRGVVYTGETVRVAPEDGYSHTTTVHDSSGEQEKLYGTWRNIFLPKDEHVYRPEWKPGMPLDMALTKSTDHIEGNQGVMFHYKHEPAFDSSGQHTDAKSWDVAEAYARNDDVNTSNNSYEMRTQWHDNSHPDKVVSESNRDIEVRGNESRSRNIGRLEGAAATAMVYNVAVIPNIPSGGGPSTIYQGLTGGQEGGSGIANNPGGLIGSQPGGSGIQ